MGRIRLKLKVGQPTAWARFSSLWYFAVCNHRVVLINRPISENKRMTPSKASRAAPWLVTLRSIKIGKMG